MELYLAITAFTVATCITPGPNNLMLATSGMNFGFKRSLPHILGIPVGVNIMLVVSTFGFGAVLIALPGFRYILASAASIYMLYLFWAINFNGSSDNGTRERTPLKIWQAAGFQMVNPKAWIVTTGLSSILIANSNQPWQQLPVACVTFSSVNLLCISAWTFAGTSIRHWYQHPIKRKIGQGIIVVLTIYCIISLWV